jgi:hypothetical protein
MLGTDPEIFIENDKNEIVSAVGLIEGTKHEPFPIDNEDHFIQIDNIAFEFNIPPCDNAEDYVKHINHVKNYLAVIAKSHGCTLSKKSSGEIDPIHLQSEEAQTFGCEPDFNVYLKDLNSPPNTDTNLRCVGGHVHISYPNPTFEKNERIVLIFDILVTLPSLLIDDDVRRRELYGEAGSFRVKNFGVECRALSNFWIHDDTLIEWVFNQTVKAVNIVLEEKDQYYIEKYSEQVREAIDTNNKNLAKQLLLEIEKEEKILTN